MDSVEGGSFIFLASIFQRRRREPLGGSGGTFPGNFANLGSLKCDYLHLDIISEVGCIFHKY